MHVGKIGVCVCACLQSLNPKPDDLSQLVREPLGGDTKPLQTVVPIASTPDLNPKRCTENLKA